MTVLVGITHNDVTWLGADSACYDGTIHSCDDKLWCAGPFVFGFTGATREQQILQHRVTLPELAEGRDVAAYLAVEFADAVRKARKDSGYERKDDGNDTAPGLLIGYAGRLFTLYSDYAISEHEDHFAGGCGRRFALGSLDTSAKFWKSPRKRIEAALEAACLRDPYCRGPFTIERSP